MKILFDSYDTCCQNGAGGVQNRLNKIYDLLSKNNISVKLFNKFDDKIDDFDILHLFKLDYQKYSLLKCAKSKNKKVVISTIVPTNANLKFRFQRIVAKLKINTSYRISEQMLKMADALICETPSEKSFINKYYKIDNNKIYVIPNGASVNKTSSKLIYDIVDKRKKMAVVVGRFDSNKNQINVIRALKDTDIELVLIGGPDYSCIDYYKKCQNEAKESKNIHFLGWLDSESELFQSALSNANILILPSYSETFGLVAIEAIMYGAKIVLSNSLSILSFKEFESIKTFNPNKVTDIRNVVIKEIESEKNNKVYEKIMKDFSWDEVIDKHIDIYRSILDEK